MGETKALAEFIVASTFDAIPAEETEKSKAAIADLVGVALYGSQHDVGERISSYV